MNLISKDTNCQVSLFYSGNFKRRNTLILLIGTANTFFHRKE